MKCMIKYWALWLARFLCEKMAGICYDHNLGDLECAFERAHMRIVNKQLDVTKELYGE